MRQSTKNYLIQFSSQSSYELKRISWNHKLNYDYSTMTFAFPLLLDVQISSLAMYGRYNYKNDVSFTWNTSLIHELQSIQFSPFKP